MRIRLSSTVALAAGLAVLVAVLATMQWRWLTKIEDSEHYRRMRLLGYSAWLFKTTFDHEVDHLARSMVAPVDTTAVDGGWLADRRDRWRASTRWPQLLAEVYVAAAGDGAITPDLAHLDPASARLVPAAWPAPLAPLAPLIADPDAGWSDLAPTQYRAVADPPALLVPAAGTEGPAVLILELDREALAASVFPEILQLVFPMPTFESLEVAITETQTGRVIYSTLDIADSSELGRADTSVGLVSAGAERGLLPGALDTNPTPPSSDRSSTVADDEWFRDLWSRFYYAGHWQLLVRHGEIPIGQEVAALRRRRATAGFGLLALLSASVALFAVTARRAQRAAGERLERLARVSHELRTPLTVLASAGDNLADGVARGDAKIEQYGRVIQKETGRLEELVENVLSLSRRRDGVPRPQRQRVDLVALAEDSLATAGPGLEEAGFTVERSLPAHTVEVLGEARALRSALLNLISNALKYARCGGWLRLAVEQDGSVEARIVVEDRGPGIAAREVPRLLAPYARGARAVAEQTEGSGLGLAVVAEVVKAHRGRISVTSPAGGGAAFTLHLPLADAR